METEWLIKRIMDLAEKSYRNNLYTYTHFLNPEELSLFLSRKSDFEAYTYQIFGGNENSERKMVGFGNAKELGYENEVDFWGLCGLLHDVDYEMYPEEHCKKAPELLKEIEAEEDMVHAICSHAYGICSDVEPVHEMEKVMFAADEFSSISSEILPKPVAKINRIKLV